MIDFMEKLASLMNHKGICAAKLARMSDVDAGTVYKFLKGRSDMKCRTLQKLFNTLHQLPNKDLKNEERS